MRILAVWWLSTCLLSTDGAESPRKEGALGPGSEALEREEAERLLQKCKLTFSEEPGPPFEPRQTSRLPEHFRQRLA
eukprot:s1538_g12.t2